MFKDTKVTRADIFFFEFDQFLTLKLGTNKINVNHTEIIIVIVVKHQQKYTLTSLCKLFFRNPELGYAPLLSQAKRKLISKYLIHTLKSLFVQCMNEARNFSSQSFTRSKAQNSSDCKILNKKTQIQGQ